MKANGAAALGEVWGVSYRTKHTLTIRSSIHAPWCLPRGAEHFCPHKNLPKNVSSSFIHNGPNLEATYMSLSRLVDKLWSIQTMEYYSVMKKELSSHEKAMEERYMNVTKWEANLTWLHTLWLQLHAFGKGKTMETDKSSVVARGWGMNRQSTEYSFLPITFLLVFTSSSAFGETFPPECTSSWDPAFQQPVVRAE